MTGTTNEALPALGAGSFTLDPSASVVGFSTKNFLGRTVRGEFPAFRTVVDVAANPAESATETTVSVASVNTKSTMRDRDLQKAKVFDSASWPEIRFSSTALTTSANSITITGDLTVRDQTHRVTLVGGYTGVTSDGAHVFVVDTVVNPRNYGIRHPMIKKPVTIQITAALIPA